MIGFRNRRLIFDGPSVWQLPPDIFQHVGWQPNDVKVWTNQLSSIAGTARFEDNRGIFMTTGRYMQEELDYVLGWVRDVLVLHRTDGWNKADRYPKFIKDILSQFYRGSDGHIASVTAESSRDPIGRRGNGFSQSLSQSGSPVFGREADHIKYEDFIPLEHGLVMPTRDLRFAVPNGYDERQVVFTKMYSKRVLSNRSRAPMVGEWITWCVAEENTDKLALGSAPASRNLLLPNDINPARLMTWWKLNPQTGWTYTIAFDLEEGSGRVFSIRYAKVQLEMQVGLDPWLDDWILDYLDKQVARSKSVGTQT